MNDDEMHDEEFAVGYVQVFLWAEKVPWSQEQFEQMGDDLAGFFKERGFGSGDEEDSPLRSVITIGTKELPEDLEEWSNALMHEDGVAMLILPMDKPPEEKEV